MSGMNLGKKIHAFGNEVDETQKKITKKLKRRQISYIINRSMVFLSMLQKILFREKTIFPIMIFISII